jgi:ferredoxin
VGDETLKMHAFLKNGYERMKMATIKVTIDRVQCIGCGIAPNLCPQVFVLGDDNGMTRVVDAYSAELTADISVGLIPEELRDCVEQAAATCPAQAITLKDAT